MIDLNEKNLSIINELSVITTIAEIYKHCDFLVDKGALRC